MFESVFSNVEISNFDKFESANSRMRFRNSTDPIYVAFEYLDNQSVSELAQSFVKDTFFEVANFVSKAIKG